MKTYLRNLQLVSWLIAAGLVFVAASPSHAEVGTFDIEGSGPFVQAIIDDPDPLAAAWQRHSPPDSQRRILNEHGAINGDGYPSLLYNVFNGLPIVAWAKNSPSGFDIVLSRFADGSWSDPVFLADSAADERDPFLALDPSDGSVHVVYWVHDTVPRVMHRSAPADVSSWSQPVVVSLPGEIAVRPAAVFHDGALYVIYEAHTGTLGGSPRQIVLATDAGSGFSSQVLATTMHGEPNWPRIHTRVERLWVEWVDEPGAMSWTRRQLGGGWDPFGDESFSGVEECEYFVRGRVRAQALD